MRTKPVRYPVEQIPALDRASQLISKGILPQSDLLGFLDRVERNYESLQSFPIYSEQALNSAQVAEIKLLADRLGLSLSVFCDGIAWVAIGGDIKGSFPTRDLIALLRESDTLQQVLAKIDALKKD